MGMGLGEACERWVLGGMHTYTAEAYYCPPNRKWDTSDCQGGFSAEAICERTPGNGSDHSSHIDDGRKNGGLDGGEMEVSHHARKRRRCVSELQRSECVCQHGEPSLDEIANIKRSVYSEDNNNNSKINIKWSSSRLNMPSDLPSVTSSVYQVEWCVLTA